MTFCQNSGEMNDKSTTRAIMPTVMDIPRRHMDFKFRPSTIYFFRLAGCAGKGVRGRLLHFDWRLIEGVPCRLMGLSNLCWAYRREC